MNIKPVGDRVVIKLAPKEEKLASGIYVPEAAQERPNEATVIAVGPGTPQWPNMQCTVGDKVLYNKFTGTPIEDDLVILQEREIFAIL